MARYYILILFNVFVTAIAVAQNFEEVASINGINSNCGDCQFGAGVSFIDFNLDGLDDITFATEEGVNIIFYQNTGSGFTQLSPPPIINTGHNKQVVWIDYDNDGDKDFFVANYGSPNRLFENDGSFNFTDITVAAGLPINDDQTWGADFGDYDNDGLLDLYISNYSLSVPNRLYKNEGDGTFTDVSAIAGIGNANYTLFALYFLILIMMGSRMFTK